MAVEPTDPLARALRAAREEPHEGWIVLSESIMSRVRSVVLPAYPVLTRSDADGSRSYVSTRVLSAALRRLLQREATHAPDGIRFLVDDERLTGVDVALVAAYGVDLVAVATRVRADVVTELGSLLGAASSLAPADVSVTFVDVVDGDPRLV